MKVMGMKTGVMARESRSKSKSKGKGEGGHILVATLVIAGVLGIALAAYMNVVQGQSVYTARSQVWHACLPIVEAGLEEGLAHINNQLTTNFNSNGWSYDSTSKSFTKQRWMGTSYFSVVIATNSGNPVITSTGYVPAPVQIGFGRNGFFAQVRGGGPVTNYISRTVKVTTCKPAVFSKALSVKEKIDFNGNNCLTDSYNSSVAPYDSLTAGDKGDVATNWDIAGNPGSADIKGHLGTGPNATVKIGPNGSVGDAAWVTVGTKGIKPGWWRKDMNAILPDVAAPWSGGAFDPSNTGNGSDVYILDGGNWELAGDLIVGRSKRLYVKQGDNVLWVKGNVDIKGKLKVQAGATLKLYTGKTNGTTSANFSGTFDKSIIPSDLLIFGLPSCGSLTIGTGTALPAALYAPNAAMTLIGSASLYGSAVSKSVTFGGNASFHYDEALATVQISRGYVITSWQEI